MKIVIKIIRIIIALFLYMWCLCGFGYNLFIAKDYILSVIWAITLFLPMSILFEYLK